MKSWLAWCEDVVRLEADNIVKETAELIDFTLNLNVWARVLLEEGVVLVDLHFQQIQLKSIVFYHLLLLKNVQELTRAELLSKLLYHCLHSCRERVQIFQCFNSEVLWGWPVILHALQVPYDVLGILLLVINDPL